MKNFGTIVVADFEYEITDGELPSVLCLVAYVLDERLRHIQTVRLWRGDFDIKPPFDIGPDALFVAYSAWAEMMCFKVLGWQFPVYIFDLHTAFLAASNVLRPHVPGENRIRPHKRLPDACRAYGIKGWEEIEKEAIARDIGEGRWWLHGRERVLAYCEEDVRCSTELLSAQLRGLPSLAPADVERIIWWSEYSAKVIAQVQARGMPIDTRLWSLIQEHKQGVIGQLLRRFDPSYGDDDPIYTPEGTWSSERFARWLQRRGIPWPCKFSGELDLEGDAFRLMSHMPGIDGLHALRDSLRVIANANLPIGRDARNRPSLFPFGTATGRNAHSKSLYNVHASMRSLIVFPPDRFGVYLDWRTQEVAIAAALSGDSALIEAYGGGDVYHALARAIGLTDEPDPKRWKKAEPAARQRMKQLQLAINYGMGIPSLARGLNRHPLIASTFIERHRRTYPRYWEWRENQVRVAMLERRLESVFGWPLRISTSPNKRTIYNFPMQSAGADMLRLAAVRLCEAGIVPCMLIHDGILLEVESEQEIKLATEIMRWAGREVCDGLEVGVDIDQKLERGARYRDKRPVAQAMWTTVMAALQAVKAVPGEALAWAS